MTDLDRTPIAFGDLIALPGVVETVELRRPVGFCAYHGGNLERRTDLIARLAAHRSDASLYTVTQPPGMRRHIPSARVGSEPTKALSDFLDHCRVVISLHGFGREGLFTTILCGGGNAELRAHVASHLVAALPEFEVRSDPETIPRGLRGQHPQNPCNLPSGGGVQLELPPRVRGLSPYSVRRPADPSIPNPGPEERYPQLAALVDGLVAAAANWPDN